MWDYSEEVMEHYRNPKNAGEIKDADAIGEAGSLACGDALKIYLKINKDGIIEDAKFQTFGCGSAVASSSILTEMIIGKHLDEVKKITNQDIADKLGGLPPEKMHCSVMGYEALEDALSKYLKEDIPQKKHEKVICQCFNVTKSKIEEGIKEHNLKDLEDVANYLKAGGACGKCHTDIQKILDDIWENKKNADLSTMNYTQKILRINNIIETHIAPQLRKDGGDVELVDIDENKVYLTLKGKCKTCKNSQLTLKNFVQASLREYLGTDIEVVEVS